MSDLRSRLRLFLLQQGWFLRRSAGLSAGVSLEIDWRHRCALPPPKFIADVGAHRGESVDRFSAAFPCANIIAFEPVAENFRVLSESCRTKRNVTCVPLAVSDRAGEIDIVLQPDSQTHTLEPRASASASPGLRRERLRVTTLDAFAAENSWDMIDLLKIDTEGHELAVLRGARELLRSSRIRAIFVEATLDPRDRTHTPLPSVSEFLQPFQFRLVALYDQAASSPSGPLAYFNALFVSDGLPRDAR